MFDNTARSWLAPVTQPDWPTPVLTCPSDAAAAPLTRSGAEVMLDPIAVLWLFIMIGPLSAMSAGAAQFRREEGTFNTTPDASVSAPSRFACSAKCASMLPCSCHGFTYHEDGTCDLYRGDKDLLETTVTPSGAPGASSYRLLPRPMCPGKAKVVCVYVHCALCNVPGAGQNVHCAVPKFKDLYIRIQFR